MRSLTLVIAALVALPLSARAEPAAPSGDEIKKVVEYYNAGKDAGPVLAEVKACLKVDTTKGSPTFLDCTEPVTGKVKKGAAVNAWTLWLVPKDGKYEDVSVQWLHEGQVRTTNDLALKFSQVGARTYLFTTVNKPGKWEVKILRGGKELGAAKFEVE